MGKKVYVLKGLIIGTNFERADIEGVFQTLEGAKKGLQEMVDMIKSNKYEVVTNESIFEKSAWLETEYGTTYDYKIVEKTLER